MEISSRTEGQLLVVSVHEPRIDAAAAISFKDAMRPLLSDGHPSVVVDLQEVGFIDSSGLGAIVATFKSLGPGRSMALAGLAPAVQQVFSLTRMDTVFRLFPTLDRALGALEA
ncbi:STAS domain-containing protein [Sulfitobacter sp. D35]|uniref:STAS domain-containing protein n=1 Tax=Sulfitobacter sp. D35 TaxID=3083252 RepID=UPI00296EDEDB|nr:STAS domain-containing protein [Sulfitobacter sp. D35]MDW4498357.1 STAS domain-containing protein [Sulfitobacter sp. D35]